MTTSARSAPPLRERQQVDALRDRAGHRAARLADDRRVEIVEEQIERARRRSSAATARSCGRRTRAAPCDRPGDGARRRRTSCFIRSRRLGRSSCAIIDSDASSASTMSMPLERTTVALVAPARAGDRNADAARSPAPSRAMRQPGGTSVFGGNRRATTSMLPSRSSRAFARRDTRRRRARRPTAAAGRPPSGQQPYG